MFDVQAALSARRGLKAQIAREAQITHSAVRQWLTVPADRVLLVERITGISRHEIRPDLYPREKRESS